VTQYVIYLAGPITGKAYDNEPEFRNHAALVAKEYQASVIVPHDLYRPPQGQCSCLTWCRAMLKCLDTIARVDAVYFLPGWHLSAGARRELVAANRAGKRLIFA